MNGKKSIKIDPQERAIVETDSFKLSRTPIIRDSSIKHKEATMNRFVKYYVDARTVDSNPLNRQLLFASVAQTIASNGTINDLQALVNYYQNEMEEMRYETA